MEEPGGEVAPLLAWGDLGPEGGTWRLTFPPPRGKARALRLELFTGWKTVRVPVTVGGLAPVEPAPPARRLAGAIRVADPLPGEARLTVGWRSPDGDRPGGELHAWVDLAAAARTGERFREAAGAGWIQWSGGEVRYALDTLLPGRWQVWAAYRRNLVQALQVELPERGALERSFELRCGEAASLEGQVALPDGKPPGKVLRLYLVPLDPLGQPALLDLRDAIQVRIEPEGTFSAPLLARGRYQVLAENMEDPGHPFLLEPRLAVQGAVRGSWRLPVQPARRPGGAGGK